MDSRQESAGRVKLDDHVHAEAIPAREVARWRLRQPGLWRIHSGLNRQFGLKSPVDALEEADCPDYLARHLMRQIKSALREMPNEDRRRRQLELANTLLEFVKVQRAESG